MHITIDMVDGRSKRQGAMSNHTIHGSANENYQQLLLTSIFNKSNYANFYKCLYSLVSIISMVPVDFSEDQNYILKHFQ